MKNAVNLLCHHFSHWWSQTWIVIRQRWLRNKLWIALFYFFSSWFYESLKSRKFNRALFDRSSDSDLLLSLFMIMIQSSIILQYSKILPCLRFFWMYARFVCMTDWIWRHRYEHQMFIFLPIQFRKGLWIRRGCRIIWSGLLGFLTPPRRVITWRNQYHPSPSPSRNT